MTNLLKNKINNLIKDIYIVSYELFKVMIPTIIVIKVLESFGATSWLTIQVAPLLGVIGLPAEVALAITTTLLTNPYAGLLVLSSSPEALNLTVAQTTIIASFMLFTHGLIVEALISRNAGLRILPTVLIRVGGGFIFCYLLHVSFLRLGLFQNQASLHLPTMVSDPTLQQWILDQIFGLLFIQAIIIVLMIAIEILRSAGVEKIIQLILSPFLKILDIGTNAATIVIVGLTLGLGFGGGLMIKEVKQGTIPIRSVVGALVLINLFHSVFEDVGLMMLLGPSLTTILLVRAIFAFGFSYSIMRLTSLLPDPVFQKLMFNQRAMLSSSVSKIS